MKTLIIKDLARTEELNHSAMAGVRGGMKMSAPDYKFGSVNISPSFDSSILASQDLMQSQQVFNATANGSAFLDCIDVHNDVSQKGKNVIVG
jgi:hypothetical protein